MNWRNALAFGVVMGGAIGWRLRGRIADELCMLTAIFFAVFSTTAGIVLEQAYRTRNAVRQGDPIGPVSRLYFCSGALSAILWFVSALVIGFPLLVLIGSLSV